MKSDHDPYPHFSEPCKKAFAFLTTHFGFSSPTEQQMGRERYIQYTRGLHCVSIAYEPSNPPVVEFFYPSKDIKHRSFPEAPALPWALRTPWTDERMETLLQLWAAHLENNENAFLTGTASQS